MTACRALALGLTSEIKVETADEYLKMKQDEAMAWFREQPSLESEEGVWVWFSGHNLNPIIEGVGCNAQEVRENAAKQAVFDWEYNALSLFRMDSNFDRVESSALEDVKVMMQGTALRVDTLPVSPVIAFHMLKSLAMVADIERLGMMLGIPPKVRAAA